MLLHDTAGLRKKARVAGETLEEMSVASTLDAIRFADCVIVMIDATAPFEKQDLTIADLIAREGRAIVFAVNKWDLLDNKAGRDLAPARKAGPAAAAGGGRAAGGDLGQAPAKGWTGWWPPSSTPTGPGTPASRPPPLNRFLEERAAAPCHARDQRAGGCASAT